MELFTKKRIGIYIYFKHVRDINKLEKYGNVISISRKNRYIYLYNETEKIDKIIEELSEKKFVKKIVKSELVELSLNFIKSSHNNFKEYEY